MLSSFCKMFLIGFWSKSPIDLNKGSLNGGNLNPSSSESLLKMNNKKNQRKLIYVNSIDCKDESEFFCSIIKSIKDENQCDLMILNMTIREHCPKSCNNCMENATYPSLFPSVSQSVSQSVSPSTSLSTNSTMFPSAPLSMLPSTIPPSTIPPSTSMPVSMKLIYPSHSMEIEDFHTMQLSLNCTDQSDFFCKLMVPGNGDIKSQCEKVMYTSIKEYCPKSCGVCSDETIVPAKMSRFPSFPTSTSPSLNPRLSPSKMITSTRSPLLPPSLSPAPPSNLHSNSKTNFRLQLREGKDFNEEEKVGYTSLPLWVYLLLIIGIGVIFLVGAAVLIFQSKKKLDRPKLFDPICSRKWINEEIEELKKWKNNIIFKASDDIGRNNEEIKIFEDVKHVEKHLWENGEMFRISPTRRMQESDEIKQFIIPDEKMNKNWNAIEESIKDIEKEIM